MHTHALTTALTLYRSGTITLEQAAHRAGRSPVAMRAALESHGIPVRESGDGAAVSGTRVRVN